MVRITGGALRGRRIQTPTGFNVRPTTDRVRQALFNMLAGEIPGARILDLFAGSGALGIEALSRGAAAVWFVESHPRHARLARENLAACGLTGRGWLHQGSAFDANLPDALNRLPGPSPHPRRPPIQEARAGGETGEGIESTERDAPGALFPGFDVVFLDPPYGQGLAERAMNHLARTGLAKPGLLAAVEHEAETDPRPDPDCWIPLKSRSHGRTTLAFWRYVAFTGSPVE